MGLKSALSATGASPFRTALVEIQQALIVRFLSACFAIHLLGIKIAINAARVLPTSTTPVKTQQESRIARFLAVPIARFVMEAKCAIIASLA